MLTLERFSRFVRRDSPLSSNFAARAMGKGGGEGSTQSCATVPATQAGSGSGNVDGSSSRDRQTRLTSARKLVGMFTPQERDRARNEVLEWASADPRVVAGAVVGSLAHEPGDRFSDLDLTFGVRDECPISEVLEDWSQRLIAGFEAVLSFCLWFGCDVTRVVLLASCVAS